MKHKTLEILLNNKNEYISGEDISQILKVSRTAVWKHITALKKDGYVIEASKSKGYKIANQESVMESAFYELAEDQIIGREYHYLKEVDSTNTYAKSLAKEAKEGTVVISDLQTQGKGRLGRSWDSKSGQGIWMSVILKPEVSLTGIFILSHLAGASICKALIDEGYDARIKWPNDVVVSGKKVCGILCEIDGEPERLNYVIVGMGINLKQSLNDFPEEIRNKATSLELELCQRNPNSISLKVDGKEILRKILVNFDFFYKQLKSGNVEEIIYYTREHSATIGKDVKLLYNNDTLLAKALDINNQGGLVIQTEDGQTMEIISGEVSVRGIYDYI